IGEVAEQPPTGIGQQSSAQPIERTGETWTERKRARDEPSGQRERGKRREDRRAETDSPDVECGRRRNPRRTGDPRGPRDGSDPDEGSGERGAERASGEAGAGDCFPER